MIVATLMLSALTILLLLYLLTSTRSKNYPDGPYSFPILGNIPQIIACGDMIQFLKKYRRIYGNVFTIKVGGVDRVVVSGFENHQNILVKNADYSSNRTTAALAVTEENINSQGLVFAKYPKWKTLRTFTLNVLRSEGMGKSTMEVKIIEEVEKFVDYYITPFLGTPIDLGMSLTYATSNVISQMVLGKRFEYGDPLLEKRNRFVDESIRASMKASITKNIPFLKYLPGDISGRKAMQAAQQASSAIRKQWMEEAKQHVNDGGRAGHFVHEALSYSLRSPKQENGDEVFTEASISATTSQLYAAGTETTATALKWALLYMCLHPEIQDRIRKEIHNAIGEKPPTMKDKLSMPYVDATIHEVLRIANIAPTGVPHRADKELTVEGKVIPTGTEMMFNVTSVLYDEEIFPEPDKFDPERFLGDKGNALKSKVVAFGLGRRACIGEALARMELFLFFVTFIQKYTVSHPPNEIPSTDPVVSIVRSPQCYRIIFNKC